MNNFIVANGDNKSDGTRFLWNGFVLRHVRTEAEFNVLHLLGMVHANASLAAPVWFTKAVLDTYPIV